MTHRDPTPVPARDHSGADRVPLPDDPAERERLVQALTLRFSPHIQAAAAAVREAEQDLIDARAELVRAQEAADSQHYRSDPLVFMRASLEDEVEALARKTTAKKVRVAYRYLVDRAAELAEGEVNGYRQDQAAATRDREQGVAACQARERQAMERRDAAHETQRRVLAAEQTARQGLAIMEGKLADQEAAR